jgi:hypothetical protein
MSENAESRVIATGHLVVNVRSGRKVEMMVPVDMTPTDVLDLISYLSTTLERELRAAKSTSRLVVPDMGALVRKGRA